MIGNGAKHCAGIDQLKTEFFSQTARYRRFARTRRPVDRYNHNLLRIYELKTEKTNHVVDCSSVKTSKSALQQRSTCSAVPIVIRTSQARGPGPSGRTITPRS